MTTQMYQQLIIEGIKGLPTEMLTEIADFVYFVRKRVSQPRVFEQDQRDALLNVELKQLSREEASHLEEEFTDYERLYPHE